MPQRLIVIDDTDPTIHYSGQWFQDHGSTDGISFFGPTYNHTLHGTISNASLSLSFQGVVDSLLPGCRDNPCTLAQEILSELGAPTVA
jgi:hypothetical protein